jgi:hypothetical protein
MARAFFNFTMLTMLGGVKVQWNDSSTEVQDQSSCELFMKKPTKLQDEEKVMVQVVAYLRCSNPHCSTVHTIFSRFM